MLMFLALSTTRTRQFLMMSVFSPGEEAVICSITAEDSVLGVYGSLKQCRLGK
jgi:hypothetical protein